jgi:DNA-binding MarR family transcriptional regulator
MPAVDPASLEPAAPAAPPIPGGEGWRAAVAGSEGAPDAEAFTEAWDEFVLAVRRAQSRGPTVEGQLTLAQYYLLLPLAGRQPSMTPSQLADRAGIAPPTATRLLDGLERAGIVQRARPAHDRRSVLVSLTAEGRERLLRRRREIAARRRRLYERLEPEERAQGGRLLHHLAELLAEL